MLSPNGTDVGKVGHRQTPYKQKPFRYPLKGFCLWGFMLDLLEALIYTTNAIESLNMSLRKITKNRGSFPSDEALLKLSYLAQQNISKKWTMPIRDWKAALNRLPVVHLMQDYFPCSICIPLRRFSAWLSW